MNYNLIDENGNAVAPARLTEAEKAAHEALKNATDEYSITGQYQRCGRFCEFFVSKRPQAVSVLYALWCPTCQETERVRVISINNEMVSVPRTDIKAPEPLKTVTAELRCVNCEALSRTELPESEALKTHVIAPCSCLEHPLIEKSQHRVVGRLDQAV